MGEVGDVAGDSWRWRLRYKVEVCK